MDSTGSSPEQPPHDDRAVGPRARAGDDQPVAAGLHRIAVAPVRRDAGGDVIGVAFEVAAAGDIGSHAFSLPQTPGSGLGLWPPLARARLAPPSNPRTDKHIGGQTNLLFRNAATTRHSIVAGRCGAESASHELAVGRLQIRWQRRHIALPFGVADRCQNAAQVVVLVGMRR